MTRSSWGPVLLLLRGVIVCAVGLSTAPVAAQVGREGGRRKPPVDGPWSENDRRDPTDATRQTEGKRRQAQAYFDSGSKMLAKGQIAAAKTRFKSVIELVGREGVGQAAFGQLTAIHGMGLEEVKRAEEAYAEGKYQEALQVCKKAKVLYAAIFEDLRGAESRPSIPRLANDLIDRIKADPKAQQAMQEEDAARLFKRIPRLKKAAEGDSRKYFDLFRALKRIASRYPASPTGRKIAEQIQNLMSDTKIRSFIEREEQRRLVAAAFARAEQYENEGRHDLAAAEVNKLRQEYPGKSVEDLRRMAK